MKFKILPPFIFPFTRFKTFAFQANSFSTMKICGLRFKVERFPPSPGYGGTGRVRG